jgi:hypothetical protein
VKTTFPIRGRTRLRLLALVSASVIAIVSLTAGCGGGGTASTSAGATPTTEVTTTAAQPTTTTTEATTTTTQAVATTVAAGTTPMSKAEVARRKTDAATFIDRYYAAYPNVDAVFADFADNAAFYDPSDGDFLIAGKEQILAINRDFFSSFPNIQSQAKATYVSGDGAIYRVSTDHLWPPWVPEPADHPPVGEYDLFRFDSGHVIAYDLWFTEATLKMVTFGWFAPGQGGPEQLHKIADAYVAAWSSGDKARIAALYRDGAVFSDTLLGLTARGPAAISELGDKRFGSADKVSIEIVDLFAQTNGPTQPTDALPQNGAIIGVGIHYRATLAVGGKSTSLEGVTTFELGTRVGIAFNPDPNGLITREEVFYNADSVIASGLIK